VNDIVALETVNDSAVAIVEIFLEFLRCKVGRYMGELVLLLPDVISGIEKLAYHDLRVGSEILMRLETDVIQANIDRIPLELR